MPTAKKPNFDQSSAFKEDGFEPVIAHLEEEVRELYLSDKVPWIIGYSGGKDSTAVLQLIWNAIAELPREKCHKPIHVISTDTSKLASSANTPPRSSPSCWNRSRPS